MSKAWQRIRREECATTDREDNLFGAWWEEIDTSLARAEVREIDQRTAANVIVKYEWMRSMPAIAWHCFGCYFEDNLGGVVVYGPEYSENLGPWDKYGYTGRLILLSRGVTVHWAHPHTASFLVRRSMALLPEKYEVVTAMVDPAAGEVGTIYQACGFVYAGSMDSHTRGEVRASSWLINGQRLTERSLRARFGGAFTVEQVKRRYPNAVMTRDVAKGAPPSKGRYFAFRGNRATKRRNRRAIEHFIQPYPKRAEGVEETSRTNQFESGGAMPLLRSIDQDAA